MDYFLIKSIENWFGDDEIIFQDNNASYYSAKKDLKLFIWKGIENQRHDQL